MPLCIADMIDRFFTGKISSATISQRDNPPKQYRISFSTQATQTAHPLPERLLLLSFSPSSSDVRCSALCAIVTLVLEMLVCSQHC